MSTTAVSGPQPGHVGVAPDETRRGAPEQGGERGKLPPSVSWRLYFGGELVLGAVLGFLFVGSHSLFLDESVSASLATAPWHRFTQVVAHREPNMGLYYLLLRGWTVFGHGEVALRSLSVVAAVGSLAVVILVARDLFGQRAALLCGFLLAVDPLFVEFAQDVRGYSLAILLVSASSLLFLRGIMRPQSRPWVTWTAYAVISALAAYANFWAALVPLGHAASVAFLPRRQISWRRLVPAGGALLVLLVPLGLLIRATDSAGTNWAAGSSAGRAITKIRDAVPHPVLDLGAVLVVAVALAVVLVARRHPPTMEAFERNWCWLFALCWLVVPLVVVVLLSLTYKPLLVVRYLSVCIPPAALLLGALLARVGRSGGGVPLVTPAIRRSIVVRLLGREVGAVALAVLLVASIVGTGLWYRSAGLEDWRTTVAYVGDQSRSGDGVMFLAPYGRIPFEWYIVQHPAWSAKVQPVYPSTAWGVDALKFDYTVVMREKAVAQAARKYNRVWLVLSQQQFTPQQEKATIKALHRDGFVAAHTRIFTGVEVVEEMRTGTQ